MISKSALAVLCPAATSFAQNVCLPAPRLLTVMPMGGQAGTSFEVTITGENLEEVNELLFSSPQITAQPVGGAADKSPVPIAANPPAAVHDARVISRLGVSSA